VQILNSVDICFFDDHENMGIRNELTGKPEDCWSFAQATFLPEGDWTKVGRIPIDGYELTKKLNALGLPIERSAPANN
jgi:hypothetical protein